MPEAAVVGVCHGDMMDISRIIESEVQKHAERPHIQVVNQQRECIRNEEESKIRYVTRVVSEQAVVSSVKPNTPSRYELSVMRDQIGRHRRWIQVGIVVGAIGLGLKAPDALEWYSAIHPQEQVRVASSENPRPERLRSEYAVAQSVSENKVYVMPEIISGSSRMLESKPCEVQVTKPMNELAATQARRYAAENLEVRATYFLSQETKAIRQARPAINKNPKPQTYTRNQTTKTTQTKPITGSNQKPQTYSTPSQAQATRPIEPVHARRPATNNGLGLPPAYFVPYKDSRSELPKSICIKNTDYCYSRSSTNLRDRRMYRELVRKYISQ